MKTQMLNFAVLAVVLLTGCASYDYQITEPANLSRRIADQPVTVMYDPLEYRFERTHGHLAMTISNPTEDRIVLRGDKSSVVSPSGDSRPFSGGPIVPRGYLSKLVPPEPKAGQATTVGIYSGSGPVVYGPGYISFFGGASDYYYGPVSTYYQIHSPYDWEWKSGAAHFRLTYERGGKTFEHDFVISREPAK